MEFRELNSEVFVTDTALSKVSPPDVEFLKQRAGNNPRGKCRLLLHSTVDAILHEMIIVHTNDKYIRPHKNVTGDKSFTVIDGAFILVLFDDDGNVVGHETLGTVGRDNSEDVFMFRLSEPRYHTLINITPQIVFLETCLGPFQGGKFADWAPKEGTPEGESYYHEICQLVQR